MRRSRGFPATRAEVRRGLQELRDAQRCERRGDSEAQARHVANAAALFERAAASCAKHVKRARSLEVGEISLDDSPETDAAMPLPAARRPDTDH